jgi:hypothetical protein
MSGSGRAELPKPAQLSHANARSRQQTGDQDQVACKAPCTSLSQILVAASFRLHIDNWAYRAWRNYLGVAPGESHRHGDAAPIQGIDEPVDILPPGASARAALAAAQAKKATPLPPCAPIPRSRQNPKILG